MSTAFIFGLGLVVTAITSAAVILVGISEAADPSHSRPEDLAGWERSLVGRGVRQKARTTSEAGANVTVYPACPAICGRTRLQIITNETPANAAAGF